MRDGRGRSPSPKRLGQALEDFRGEISPATPLAAVQTVWDEVVGERIAQVTDVVDEREGMVTVECVGAAWAQELEMMAPRIAARLRDRLGSEGPAEIRFRTARD